MYNLDRSDKSKVLKYNKSISIDESISLNKEKEFINYVIDKLNFTLKSERVVSFLDNQIYEFRYELPSFFIFELEEDEFYYDIILDLYNIISDIVSERPDFSYYANLWFFYELDYIKGLEINIKDYFRYCLLNNIGFFRLFYKIENELLLATYEGTSLDDLDDSIINRVDSYYLYINIYNFTKKSLK